MFLKFFHDAAQNVYKATASVVCSTSLKGLLFSREEATVGLYNVNNIHRQTDRQTDR